MTKPGSAVRSSRSPGALVGELVDAGANDIVLNRLSPFETGLPRCLVGEVIVPVRGFWQTPS